MNPDSKPEEPARKETQEFDPALVDEEGIHSKRAPNYLMHESDDEEVQGEPDRSEIWQNFETP